MFCRFSRPRRSAPPSFPRRPRRCSGAIVLACALAAGCASVAPEAADAPVAMDAPAVKLEGTRYLEIRVGRHIDAPPSAVWAVLTEGERYTEWNSTITSFDGVIEQGGELTLKNTLDPDRTFNLEVTHFEPTTRMVWEDGGRAFHGARTFTLTSTPDGGTDFTMVEVFTGTMMGMIASKLPDFRPAFDAFAKDLETEAVQRAATP